MNPIPESMMVMMMMMMMMMVRMMFGLGFSLRRHSWMRCLLLMLQDNEPTRPSGLISRMSPDAVPCHEDCAC